MTQITTNPEAEAELEAKFFDLKLDEVRAKLQEIGAALETPERLMRRVVYGGEANQSMQCTYGRIRDEGNKITMSAKYSAKGNEISSQKEAMITVDSFEHAMAVLEGFGLQITNYQESKRETWKLPDSTLVELEQWPDLPHYIEIEGPTVDAVKKTAARLDLTWEAHTLDSTDKLYQKHFSLSDTETQQKLADLRFI